MALGCFVSVGRSLEQAVTRVQLAEELGYESCYVTHIAGREALTVLTHYADHTERIRLGTGVTPIYTRVPANMAQTAATVDEISAGRLNLGLGVSHRPVVEGWFGQTIDKPASEMREYVAIVRAILRGEDPPPGEKWQTGFHLSVEPRPDLPIYIAALSPRMLRLAGEIADGVILWLCNPNYIRDVVVPEVTKGREKAGKGLDGFDIVPAVPSALTDDVGAAYATMRRDLLTYFSLPFYRAMIERSGFAADLETFDAAAAKGDGDAMGAAISDDFLGVLTAIGDEDAVRAGIQRYQDAGATSPCVGRSRARTSRRRCASPRLADNRGGPCCSVRFAAGAGRQRRRRAALALLGLHELLDLGHDRRHLALGDARDEAAEGQQRADPARRGDEPPALAHPLLDRLAREADRVRLAIGPRMLSRTRWNAGCSSSAPFDELGADPAEVGHPDVDAVVPSSRRSELPNASTAAFEAPYGAMTGKTFGIGRARR